ncbi:hypothetical protein [Photobacterium sp. GB-72]|uniref:hypothetical protein n=1 Tax=Photobacterium sp. GB-72 TaxID=2022105 RepID=UPI000D15B294|nr:hypothetical protein [Photobacterium sp. GB-72]PSV28072.1 hypothetical protein C9J40_19525 [Photobacterium sp. GB-72]
MLNQRIQQITFSVMLFVCTSLVVIPSFLILSFEISWPWFHWSIILTALAMTLPLYLYRLKVSNSNVSYISYSVLTSIVIISIVSISYTLLFNEFRREWQETPNLLPFVIIPFYILMCFKYSSLNIINSKVGKYIVTAIGAASAALVGIFVIAADAAVQESEDNKPTIDDSPDGHIGWNGGYKYSDNSDEN